MRILLEQMKVLATPLVYAWDFTGVLSVVYSIMQVVFNQSALHLLTLIFSFLWAVIRIYREVLGMRREEREHQKQQDQQK